MITTNNHHAMNYWGSFVICLVWGTHAFAANFVAGPVGSGEVFNRAKLPICKPADYVVLDSNNKLVCKSLPQRSSVSEHIAQSSQTNLPALDAKGKFRIVKASCPSGKILLSCGGGLVKSGLRKPDQGGSIRSYSTRDLIPDYTTHSCTTAFPAQEWDIINIASSKPELIARAYCIEK